jgi:hypothetical protein
LLARNREASRKFSANPNGEAAMSSDKLIRSALWASVVLNAAGLVVFVPPALGYAQDLLPIPAPRFFVAQVAVTIALFGGAYAWLARQPRIDRPLVVVGGIGKLAFFGLALAYWLAGDLPAAAVPQAAPDLILGAVFLWWARGHRADAPAITSVPAS